MVNRNSRRRALMPVLALCLCLSGCMMSGNNPSGEQWTPAEEVPEIPSKLIKEGSIPSLTVYDVSDKTLKEMDVETYVMGVVAGEMKNDWPEEALKAQAILARTFVMKFCQDKSSKYDGADISTDVTEAQAYAANSVNDRVRKAVGETRGLVLAADGEYPYAWFHAHSGGMTELPGVALDFKGENPEYLESVRSDESDKAPQEVKHWTVTFTRDEVLKACSEAGLRLKTLDSIELGPKGESGRAKTLLINGESVSAPSFRLHIGANRLKSTLIESVKFTEDGVTFTGRGFGHGVGMSQWGAYAMAENGKSAEEILSHYFKDIQMVRLW